MAEIFLSIGSNIQPSANITRCALALDKHFHNVVWSSVYQSAAVGMTGDDFLNAVVSAETTDSINDVETTLKAIEKDQGRQRSSNKYMSRTLDIDLLLYSDVVLNTSAVELPRAEILTAAHVLVPLAELVPSNIHPVTKKTYSQLRDALIKTHADTTLGLQIVEFDLNRNAPATRNPAT